jgi:GAF domain-containing protein
VGIDEQAAERAMAHPLWGLKGSVDGPAQVLAHQLDTVVSAAAELLGVDCVGVLLLDESDRVRAVAFTGPAAEALETAQERLQLGPGVDVQSLRRVVAVPDLAENPSYRPLWREVAEAGVRGVLSAPVWVGHQVVGNLNAVTARAHDWTDAERRAGEACASLVAQLLLSATRAARRDGSAGTG